MPLTYSITNPPTSYLDGTYAQILPLLREAALRLIARYGWERRVEPTDPDGTRPVRIAWKDGIVVRHHRCRPDVLPRVTRGRWSTREGSFRDPLQNVIYIEIGRRVVVGLGWRGDGPIVHDRFERGPWENELLQAAGLGCSRAPPTGQRLLAFPTNWTRWAAIAESGCDVLDMKLAAPLTFAAVGYSDTTLTSVEPGTGLLELADIVKICYDESRKCDGELLVEAGLTSGFCLHAWADRRAPRSGRPKATAGFQYWIGPRSIPLAAALLLQFDRAMRDSGGRLPDEARSFLVSAAPGFFYRSVAAAA